MLPYSVFKEPPAKRADSLPDPRGRCQAKSLHSRNSSKRLPAGGISFDLGRPFSRPEANVVNDARTTLIPDCRPRFSSSFFVVISTTREAASELQRTPFGKRLVTPASRSKFPSVFWRNRARPMPLKRRLQPLSYPPYSTPLHPARTGRIIRGIFRRPGG